MTDPSWQKNFREILRAVDQRTDALKFGANNIVSISELTMSFSIMYALVSCQLTHNFEKCSVTHKIKLSIESA